MVLKTKSRKSGHQKEEEEHTHEGSSKRPRADSSIEEVSKIVNHSKKTKTNPGFSLLSCWKSASSTLKNIPFVGHWDGL